MAQKKSSRSRKSTKNNSNMFFTAIVALALLVIIILFLVKKDLIVSNLKETDFFNKTIGSTPEFVEKHEVLPEKTEQTVPLKEEEITIKVESEKTVPLKAAQAEDNSEDLDMDALKGGKKSESEAKKSENVEESEKSEKLAAAETAKKEKTAEVKKEEPKVATTNLSICFIEIDSDGSVVRKIVKRTVKKNDSPLGTALGLLLQGPDTTKSVERNCISLIPQGTKLLSAKVKDGVAYLNFNEAFEINTYGVEGYIGQLMQVVYTATEFSTVKSVQFLIEGEKKEYLGSEGQWIGSPLSRSSF